MPPTPLVASLPLGLYRTLPDGTIVEANQALAELMGFPSVGDLVRKTATALHQEPADRARFLEELRQAAPRPRERFLALRRADGKPLWVRDLARAHVDSAGRVQHIDGVMEDITKRMELERTLRMSEQQYRNLVENAGDCIYHLDLEGRFLSANKAAERLFGYTLEEFRGKSVHDLVDPRDRGHALKRMRAKIEGREDTPVYEVRMSTKDGRTLWAEVASRAVWQDGRPTGIQGILRDVSERHRQADRLAASESRLREIWDNANDILYIHDLAGRFLDVNQAALRTYGYSREEFHRMTIKDLVDPSHVATAQANLSLKAAGAIERTGPYELLTRAKDGSAVWVEVSTRTIAQDGGPASVQGIARNTTRRKAAEARAREEEDRYRTLVEGLPVGVFRTSVDGRFLEANPALLAILRAADFSDLRDRRVEDFYASPETRPQILERATVTGDASFEAKVRRLDGSIGIVRGRTRPRRDDAGALVAFEGLIEDVTQARIDEAGVRLVSDMAMLLSKADDFTTALQATLDHVCQATGWVYGEAWVPDDEGHLVCSPAWHEGKPGLGKFHSLSSKMRFGRTEGLAGELWETKRPLWREDLSRVPNLRRNAAANAAGLHTLVAVPVLDGDQSVADLVFLHTEWRPEDRRWTTAIEAIATQLGSIMGRRRTEDRLRRQVRLLAAEQENNPVPAVTTGRDGSVLSGNRAFLDLAQARLRPGVVPDARGEVPFRDRIENPDRLLEFARLVCENPEPTVKLAGQTYRRIRVALHDENDLPIGQTWYFPPADLQSSGADGAVPSKAPTTPSLTK